MSSGTDPPIYVTGVIFDDNLSKFRDELTLAQCVEKWLDTMFTDIPFVISPLHKPTNGKVHIHCILQLSPYQPLTYNDISATFKAYDLPRPELVRDIFGAELYLTHDTPQSRIAEKQIFTAKERAEMIFAKGYKLHKQTARDKADDISLVVSYICERLKAAVCSDNSYSTLDLYELIEKPDFYSDLESSLPYPLIVSKARNELRVHYRFYMQITKDFKNRAASHLATTEEEYFCDSLISDLVANSDINGIRILHYSCYAQFPKYKALLAKNSYGHYEFARNLRLAVNYFKSFPPDMKKLYSIFYEYVYKG